VEREKKNSELKVEDWKNWGTWEKINGKNPFSRHIYVVMSIIK
jgi:hypothetical protein